MFGKKLAFAIFLSASLIALPLGTLSAAANNNAAHFMVLRGTPVVLYASVQNDNNSPRPFVAIIEVLDSNGVVDSIQLKDDILSANDHKTVQSTWLADTTGNYSVISFVVDSLNKPRILSQPQTTFVSVVEIPTVSLTIDKSIGNQTAQPSQDTEYHPQAAANNTQNSLSAAHKPSLDELLQYALKAINHDREKYGLSDVRLSSNQAAQAHAQDMYNNWYPTHWTSDGMKPYMRYTAYGGNGYVVQNVAAGPSYDNATIAQCKSDPSECYTVDPYKEIDHAEYAMMYNDSACCEDGHRDNILDKYHTDVSIGIIYDDYYFAIVQNFENNYIQYDKPITKDNRTLEFSGKILSSTPTSGGVLADVEINYDDVPTHAVYLADRDRTSYDEGTFIGGVSPDSSYYVDAKTILASRWDATTGSIDLSFDLSPILDKKGVYTVYVYLEDRNGNQFPVTSHSIFNS